MNVPALVFSAKDGLANRLRALVGFRTLAEVQKLPMLLHWARDGGCDADFTDLFELTGWEDMRLISAEEAAAHKMSHPEHHHYSSLWFTDIWSQHAQSLCSLDEFSRIALGHLRKLLPLQELQSRVDTFSRDHDLAECVGIHVRMTDKVNSEKLWSQLMSK